MQLRILVTHKEVTLSLTEGKRVIDSETLAHYHNLDGKLIIGLEKLLHRQGVDVSSVKGYTLESSLNTDSTSYQIARAFIEGLKA